MVFMRFNQDVHHRRSIRLPGHGYASSGAYFFTIVAKDREALFDDIAVKQIVDDAWHELGDRNSHVRLDVYVVMPNHFHGILFIAAVTKPKPLGRLIGSFKTMSTNGINALRDTPGAPVWQRNYYERIIRNQTELARTRQYIRDNPANWHADPENPAVATSKLTPR